MGSSLPSASTSVTTTVAPFSTQRLVVALPMTGAEPIIATVSSVAHGGTDRERAEM
jgi:hypothetical protein